MTDSGETAVFIPCRLESRRLEGKSLVDIHGLPMVVHVVRRCVMAGVGTVYVATDSDEIAEAVRDEDAMVVMTSSEHQTGSDRIAEAARQIEAEWVINVQGDEALVRPEHVRAMDSLMRSSPDVNCALLVARMTGLSVSDIKVTTDLFGRVLYLSRADIPFAREGGDWELLKAYHVVGFRRSFLFQYAAMQRTPLELMEFNEYLRILEHGYRIHTQVVENCASSVDTVEDLEKVRKAYLTDDIFPKYSRVPRRQV